MDPSGRIAELLDDESPRKRIAAAMVLGELKAKDAGVKTRCPRLVNATPEVRAMLSQLLPAVGGRQSLARAEAASMVLAQLPGGDSLLAEALADAEDKTGWERRRSPGRRTTR